MLFGNEWFVDRLDYQSPDSEDQKLETYQELLDWQLGEKKITPLETIEQYVEYPDSCSPKEVQEIYQRYLNEYYGQLYDLKRRIVLNSSSSFHTYLQNYDIYHKDDLPENLSSEEVDQLSKKYPENITARELHQRYPEIYKLFYVDKINIAGQLITELEIGRHDNERINVENRNGFTLNQIAYSAGEFFKILYLFRPSYIAKVTVRFSLYQGTKPHSLGVYVGCDS